MNYILQKKINRPNRQSGQAILIAVIMCTSIFLAIVIGVVEPTINELQISNNLLNSKANLYVAESSAEDAVYRVKNNLILDYTTPISLNLNGYEASTTVPQDGSIKTIDTTGSAENNFRKIETNIVSGVGVHFNYAVQTGAGGLSLIGSSQINGNVYSTGSVGATGDATIIGDVWAHNVTGANVAGTIYCQTGTGNNKLCDISRNDPPEQNFPITDADIQTWKASATSTGAIYSGDLHVTSTSTSTGPMKITGNLIVGSDGTLILTGTIWVQGNIIFENGGKLELVSDYSKSGGVLIADGNMIKPRAFTVMNFFCFSS